MKSKVYFVQVPDAENINEVNRHLSQLLAKSNVLACVKEGHRPVIKLHFGEEGTTGYVRPDHLRFICDEIVKKRATPFLSDANTLYRGKRLNSEDHLNTAMSHGFTKQAVGVDVFIPNDTKKDEIASVQIDQRHIKTAKVGRCYVEADSFLAVTHFKGHGLTGFGGTLKNIGMGCATREGKLAQHNDAAPIFYADKCVGCGECVAVCPADAISMENDKSVLDKKKCIGCASCVAACSQNALFVDFEAGDDVQRKMVEYALAILKDKKGKAGFLNFALRINKECDCWAYENSRIAPDVGILASVDPVAIDKASLDVVNAACGKEIFKEAHPQQNALLQLEYAQMLGLGSIDYELIRV
jgi:uncharacterized Fe-S center protein